MNIKNNEGGCPICLLDIDENQIMITECGHKFCVDCMKQLENKHIINETFTDFRCPLCRRLLIGEMREIKDFCDGDVERLFRSVPSSEKIYFLMKIDDSIVRVGIKAEDLLFDKHPS